MKIQDLTIDQFQRLAAIEMSPVLSDMDKRVGVVAITEGISVELVREMQAGKLAKHYRTIIDQWNELPAMQFKSRFKAGGKWWKPTLFTDELTAGQLIELMDYKTSDEKALVQDLHRIMATLTCECRFYKWLPKKYDGGGHAERASLMKQHATMGDVWGVVSFFLLSSESYLQILTDYSKHLMKKVEDSK